jgi:hypothetical protein
MAGFLFCKQGVTGSIPVTSTTFFLLFIELQFLPDCRQLRQFLVCPFLWAIQAIYQAYRLVEVAGRDARVVEIGDGMGRTALYAHTLGIRNYTIFDLPLTNVM